MITQALLRDVLSYDLDTGEFRRIQHTSNRIKVGQIAGTVGPEGYRVIRVAGQMQKAHRLAWLYVYGQWPDGQIDHINGIRGDNRISNLREATNSVNQQNLRRAKTDSKTGLLGASPSFGGFKAQIKINGKVRHLGQFATAEAAHAAYLAAKRELHKGCTI